MPLHGSLLCVLFLDREMTTFGCNFPQYTYRDLQENRYLFVKLGMEIHLRHLKQSMT